ncbi:Nn.00g037910.m01.CDS01 [Neocucurbitaria sp. VM-36]
MDTETHLTSAPAGEVCLSEAQEAAIAQFLSVHDTCIKGWQTGSDAVVIKDNIQELFGDSATQYLARSLVEQVGEPVTFTSGGSDHNTYVQMPKNQSLQLFPQVHQVELSKTDLSERATIATNPLDVGLKKAPRPMNCWIIFRDAMHRKLKVENPHLTVQQISTRCSEIWHNLSPAEKKPWQAAAKSAKEEHLRQHPDYKYTPRKPGEKKKRQSRKAKRAAAAAAAAGMEPFTFQSFSDMKATSTPANSLIHTMSADTLPTSGGNIFVNDAVQLTEPATHLSLLPQTSRPDASFHDSESLRHGRLENEFGVDFGITDPLEFFHEEAFAFRAGADGNATLPSIYSDAY